MDTSFHQRLIEYCDREYYPWHMPGHKRRYPDLPDYESSERAGRNNPADRGIWCMNAVKYYDVTELPGLDDLYEPTGSLADSMQALADLYGSTRSYYQVNGSTGGILAAISATVQRGEAILMARNCHRSVYHAVALLELTPYYLEPPFLNEYGIYGGISAKKVKEALKEHPDIRAVVLTSPTYEGVVSDIAGIVWEAHNAGIYVIVDQAHGAHYTFDAQDISSAVVLGADLVIESLHKTLPCYTQCAILHIGNQVTEQESFIQQVERYIRIYQTTSPSYLFVADMERVIATMAAWRKTEFPAYLERLRHYRKKWRELRHIHVLSHSDVQNYGGYRYDETRLVLIPDRISGEQMRSILEKSYGQVMEMASIRYALAISTVVDSEEAFLRLDDALCRIDEGLKDTSENVWNHKSDEYETVHILIPVLKQETSSLIPGIAWNLPSEYMEITASEGRLAGDYVTVYPPGIPVCVPGEKVTSSVIEHIIQCYQEGLIIHGIRRG